MKTGVHDWASWRRTRAPRPAIRRTILWTGPLDPVGWITRCGENVVPGLREL